MSSTNRIITYDYSDLKANNVTPTKVNVVHNGSTTQIYRLRANGRDFIHKDVETITDYSGTVTLQMQYRLEISNYDSWSDCGGSYSSGKATITITPVLVSTSGDVIEASISRVITNQNITLGIGTSSDTATINANTDITNGITRTIYWDFNYGEDELNQVNASSWTPFTITTNVTFDSTVGVYSTESTNIPVANTIKVLIVSFSGNGVYYRNSDSVNASHYASHSESYREY